jgi:hypothetical protein
MSSARYRILDEIEPVKEHAWALHPQLPFWGSMLLITEWLAVVGVANSWLLGHPRRHLHTALGGAAIMGKWAIIFVVVSWFPEATWKYASLLLSAIRLWLGYYLNEEQEWASEMFEHSGGRIVSFRSTFALLCVMARYLPGRLIGKVR